MQSDNSVRRTPIVAGNWKMNTDVAGALALVRGLRTRLEAATRVEKVLCPPFISLAPVKEELASSTIKVGAQNLFWEDKGAYTGEISPLMLKSLCEYVIVGHSERRQYFGETDETVNKRIHTALRHGLKVIFCVGENLEQNRAGQAETLITGQVRAGLANVASLTDLVVAYEPVWAIGTGLAATAEDAARVAGFIRRTLAELYGAQAAQATRIQYGGSVTPANIADFMREPDVDGALVGGASLKADDFAAIVEGADRVRGA
ncbi:MAG: triose-phosphate isomerase [Chloroflexota bacterium]